MDSNEWYKEQEEELVELIEKSRCQRRYVSYVMITPSGLENILNRPRLPDHFWRPKNA